MTRGNRENSAYLSVGQENSPLISSLSSLLLFFSSSSKHKHPRHLRPPREVPRTLLNIRVFDLKFVPAPRALKLKHAVPSGHSTSNVMGLGCLPTLSWGEGSSPALFWGGGRPLQSRLGFSTPLQEAAVNLNSLVDPSPGSFPH